MLRFADIPITVVRERGAVIECWAHGPDGEKIALPITGFALDCQPHTPGDATLRLHGIRVKVEDR